MSVAAVPLLLGLEAVLTGLDGNPRHFDLAARKATVVVFVSTVCPVSGDYLPRLERLWSEFRDNYGVTLLVVFPNKTESLVAVRKHVVEMRFPFPAYRDEGNVLADRLGALVTPTAVVCDRTGAVAYIGAIDDAVNPARVKRDYLRDAIRAVLSGRQPEAGIQTPYGCTIKRIRK